MKRRRYRSPLWRKTSACVLESPCIDCGVNTTPCAPHEDWEQYMLEDAVWVAAGLPLGRRVGDPIPAGGVKHVWACIGCVERRLGRRLTPSDFSAYSINEPSWWDSDRLADRKGHVAAPGATTSEVLR